MSGFDATVAAYLALVAVAAVLEVLGRRPGSTIPTFGDVVAATATTTTGRLALLVLWWWAGWHFLARSSIPPVGPYP